MLYVPVNKFSVISGQFPVFWGWTSTKQWINSDKLIIIKLLPTVTQDSTYVQLSKYFEQTNVIIFSSIILNMCYLIQKNNLNESYFEKVSFKHLKKC